MDSKSIFLDLKLFFVKDENLKFTSKQLSLNDDFLSIHGI